MMNMKGLAVMGGGIGLGEVVGYATDWAEQTNPQLRQYYFSELLGLVGGPAVVAVGYKLSKGRHQTEAELAALTGMTMFIDRVGKLAAAAIGIKGGVSFTASPPRAPPPGFNSSMVQHSPWSSQQRLPFQSDLTW